jgi:hypothetical protein
MCPHPRLLLRTAALAAAILTSLASNRSALAQAPGADASGKPYLYWPGAKKEALLDDRSRFLKEIYHPTPEELAKIERLLADLYPAHEKYASEISLTVHRVKMAAAIVNSEQKTSNDPNQPTLETFKRQLERLYAGAPLSLARVAARMEMSLRPPDVAAARERLTAKFAPLLAPRATPIDLDELDALVGPAFVPGPPPIPPTPRPTQAPFPIAREELGKFMPTHIVTREDGTPVEVPAAAAQKPAAPPAMQQPNEAAAPPHAHSPAPPIQPTVVNVPREIKPAPPLADWDAYPKSTAERLGFTAEQTAKAEAIASQCKQRAAQYRDETKEAYADLARITDPAAAAEKRKALDAGFDQIYDEMTQRVDAIATIEQVVNAKPAAEQKK